MNTLRSAAFFDFDGTLIRGDSQSMELDYVLAREKPSLIFNMRLAGPALTCVLARLGLVSQEMFNRSYIKTYRGFSVAHLEERGRRLFKQKIRHDLMGGAMDLISRHRQKGHLIILVSASPYHLLGPVSEWLKFDHVACTRLDVSEDGRCSGFPRGPVCIGQAKADAVRRLAGEMGLDLPSSHAYSDHHADATFLESVGHPATVNPSSRLHHIARQRNWPVHWL